MIRFNNQTRQFATESIGTSLSNNLVPKKFVIVFRDSKTGQTKQKKLTAKTKIDALGKFRNSLRFNALRGGFYRPINIRAFEYPKQAEEAAEYRSTIDTK